MQCKKYEDTCCINTVLGDESFKDSMCYECMIDTVIEHDKLLDEGKITN